MVNRQKQMNDGRCELCIYSRVSSRVAECAMIDPQYICSGLLKISLGSQEAACFYVNEETGLFGILLFFPMCLLTMLSKQENRNQHPHPPLPRQPGLSGALALLSLLLWAQTQPHHLEWKLRLLLRQPS